MYATSIMMSELQHNKIKNKIPVATSNEGSAGVGHARPHLHTPLKRTPRNATLSSSHKPLAAAALGQEVPNAQVTKCSCRRCLALSLRRLARCTACRAPTS